MARKFTESEKEVIRTKLIEHGKKLFSQYGLKKTSIAELAAAAGIAQGSFYKFFQSKEELYFAIVEQEEAAIHEALLKHNHVLQNLTKEGLKQFLTDAIALIESNPFFQHMFEEDVVGHLVRKLPPETINEHLNKDAHLFLPLIKQWQADKRIVDLDPQLVLSIFRALILLTGQKRLIGEDLYEQTMDLLITFIADGLIREGDADND
ncbi:AcrR family transcriptional regulator [Caldalkalibacillus uzonensis]|uniref:AcrR family transcriptional regulator n=1 Tax=Caldalkalibacillus uzonensis TaxID=353224 RepID=A0ABU0CPE6_9BACI|nr:TetR/AcrR family transcriptional regulator [Caldalkalibacillus uzonensis]MDQ0338022.1 AcrR family transcriptional regulator [Caldalkalibacillus uzonensis]